MVWAATMRRAAYDPETISMLSSVLERAIAALPHQQRTEDGKARLASSILAAAALPRCVLVSDGTNANLREISGM